MRRVALLVVWLCFAAALFCLAYPVYVIRPFRHQGAVELAAALRVMEWRGVVSALCAACAVVSVMVYWRVGVGRWRRIGVLAATVLATAFAALTHINVYEKMFHPIDAPAFDTLASAHLDPEEKVLAVHLGGGARAYPVRAIAYHHIVNDSVDGVPIVATY